MLQVQLLVLQSFCTRAWPAELLAACHGDLITQSLLGALAHPAVYRTCAPSSPGASWSVHWATDAIVLPCAAWLLCSAARCMEAPLHCRLQHCRMFSSCC